MFKKFTQFFKPEYVLEPTPLVGEQFYLESKYGIKEFLDCFGGRGFNRGIYRTHKISDISKWNFILGEAFPEFKDGFICFGYDWLGRHFALDLKREVSRELLILMFEPGTGEVLEIPVSLHQFHEIEVVDFQNESLAVDFFKLWIERQNGKTLSHGECAGYKVPLFLGGKDEISNLEIMDMEVYWNICSQLLQKVRHLPPGASISQIQIG